MPGIFLGLGLEAPSSGSGAASPSPRDQAIALFDGGVKGLLLDPSALTSMFVERTGAFATTPAAVNGPVGTIASLVNGYYAVVPTADSRRPTLRQDGNGKYYLEFVSANTQNLQVASFVLSNRFYVGRAIQNGASNQFHMEHSATAVTNSGFFFTDIAAACWLIRRTASHLRGMASGSWIGTNVTVAELFYKAAARTVKANNVVVVPTGAETGSIEAQSDVTATLNIGARNNTSLPFNGRLYGLTVYDGEISTESENTFKAWLAATSGVTL